MDWHEAESAIERFEKMTRINVRELKYIHRASTENKRLGDWDNITSDKRIAVRKSNQLQEWLRQALEIRGRLKVEDLDKFDAKIEPLRVEITSTIRSLNEICSTEASSAQRNIYSDLYDEQTSSTSLRKAEPTQQQREFDEMQLRVEQAREDAEATKRLATNIEDLNEIMMELGQLVHAQHEVVDSIEEHVERSKIEVESGHKNLKKAQASRNSKVPLVAAAVGGVALGGPVGIVAGSAIAGIAAAVGGVVAGLYGGRVLKKKAEEAANRQL